MHVVWPLQQLQAGCRFNHDAFGAPLTGVSPAALIGGFRGIWCDNVFFFGVIASDTETVLLEVDLVPSPRAVPPLWL